MCGHGAIGLGATLAYLGRIKPGAHRFETPVGVVNVDLISPNTARVENVESYCFRKDVRVEVAGLGEVCGDIAWGGNWFFLVDGSPVQLMRENIPTLTYASTEIRRALAQSGITGADGAEIDHIEFFETPPGGADSRNFVLCPGGAYDRSPCGTGTSAKLACLAESGKLAPGENWIQESIVGSRFVATYRECGGGRIIPFITGSAYICGEAKLVFQDDDPFRSGIT